MAPLAEAGVVLEAVSEEGSAEAALPGAGSPKPMHAAYRGNI